MRAGRTYSGDVNFGSESAWGMKRYFEKPLRYFDRWLKDIQQHRRSRSTGVGSA